MPKDEIFCSVDLETVGPCPGVHSILSVGIAAFNSDGELISTYSVNLNELPNGKRHPDTMKWWTTQSEAWEETRKNTRDPGEAMIELDTWLKSLPGKPVFVGYPAGFDFSHLMTYLHMFTGECTFGFSALDIKSYAMAILKTDFSSTVKRNMPKKWFSKGVKHSHVALEDAIEQGYLFFEIFKENLNII